MNVAEFRKWRQKGILGISFRLVPHTGQYDPTKLINWGNNRWAFKPELGYSQRWGHWILNAYSGVWFYTTNHEFFSLHQFSPGANTQTESPFASFEGHLSYDFKPRLWVSLDGNDWSGGATQHKWGRKPQHSSEEFTCWRNRFDPLEQASVHQVQLQQRGIHPVRRELSKCFCRLAVLLVGPTLIAQSI